MDVIYAAFHSTKTTWNKQIYLDIPTISNESSMNRKKLEHIYLQQSKLNLRIWTLIGGFSFSTIISIFVIFTLIKITCENRANGPRRSLLRVGGVE